MTKLEFTCSDEKSVFLLKAARLYDEGVKLEPVRHGRWIIIEENETKCLMECGACKDWINHDRGYISKYCPNCGAKMDAEG